MKKKVKIIQKGKVVEKKWNIFRSGLSLPCF